MAAAQQTSALPFPIPPAWLAAGALMAALLIAGIAADVILYGRVRRRRGWLVERARAIGARLWTWREGAILLAGLTAVFVALLFAAGIARRLHLLNRPEAEMAFTLAYTLLFQGIALCLVIALMRRRAVSWATGFGISARAGGRRARQALLGYTGAILPVLATSLLSMGLLRLVGYPVQPQDAVRLFTEQDVPLWMQVTLAVLATTLAPCVEEILFRGIALPLALKHLSPAAAVGSVSLCFALVHFHVASIVPLMTFAVALSLAYIATGSLLVPILMHAIFNGANLILLLLTRSAPVWAFWS